MKYSFLARVFLAGVLATLIMDAGNRLAVLTGIVDEISLPMIGRLITAWLSGHFTFESPAAVPHLDAERLLGIIYHYSIGTTFAAGYLAVLRGRPATLLGAFAFGVATSLISLLVAFPSMGLGFFASEVRGTRPLLTSVVNHSFFGVGLFVGCRVAMRLVGLAPVAEGLAPPARPRGEGV